MLFSFLLPSPLLSFSLTSLFSPYHPNSPSVIYEYKRSPTSPTKEPTVRQRLWSLSVFSQSPDKISGLMVLREILLAPLFLLPSFLLPFSLSVSGLSRLHTPRLPQAVRSGVWPFPRLPTRLPGVGFLSECWETTLSRLQWVSLQL